MTLINYRSLACAILVSSISLSSIFVARAQEDPPLATSVNQLYEEVRTLDFDPVNLNGPGMKEYSTTVSEHNALWLQLDLSGTVLQDGDKVCIMSTSDGAEECLSADALEASNKKSAAFNGDSVEIYLLRAGGNTGHPSVLDIANVIVGLDPNVAHTICGSTDDRVESFERNQGRCGGCTCWLIAESHALTAGHCVSNAGSSRSMHFNIPRSTSSGGTQNPGPEDQYPGTVLARVNGGVGNDWAVIELGTNSVTGLTAGAAQSAMSGWTDYYMLGDPAAMTTGATTIDITGYGTSSIGVLNQVQKTHDGTLYSMTSTSLHYRTDTTGGNSGSPVVDEDASAIEGRPVAVGIHTHGGCSSSGTTSSNAGTRIDRSELKSFVDGLDLPGPSPTPTTAPPPPPTTTAATPPPPTPATTPPPPAPTTTPPPSSCRREGRRCRKRNCAAYDACCCAGLTCVGGIGTKSCQRI